MTKVKKRKTSAQQVLAHMKGNYKLKGISLTVRESCDAIGIKSTLNGFIAIKAPEVHVHQKTLANSSALAIVDSLVRCGGAYV